MQTCDLVEEVVVLRDGIAMTDFSAYHQHDEEDDSGEEQINEDESKDGEDPTDKAESAAVIREQSEVGAEIKDLDDSA